jgi:hypothetical protein
MMLPRTRRQFENLQLLHAAEIDDLDRMLDEKQGLLIDARRRNDRLEGALQGLYEFLPRYSCKALKYDGCPVCVAKEVLGSRL